MVHLARVRVHARHQRELGATAEAASAAIASLLQGLPGGVDGLSARTKRDMAAAVREAGFELSLFD